VGLTWAHGLQGDMADPQGAGQVPLVGASKQQVELYILLILQMIFITKLHRQKTLTLEKDGWKYSHTVHLSHILGLV
jgi:hypothetical protein